jgi:hypothetical protein
MCFSSLFSAHGNVTTYEWRYGEPPLKIEAPPAVEWGFDDDDAKRKDSSTSEDFEKVSSVEFFFSPPSPLASHESRRVFLSSIYVDIDYWRISSFVGKSHLLSPSPPDRLRRS